MHNPHPVVSRIFRPLARALGGVEQTRNTNTQMITMQDSSPFVGKRWLVTSFVGALAAMLMQFSTPAFAQGGGESLAAPAELGLADDGRRRRFAGSTKHAVIDTAVLASWRIVNAAAGYILTLSPARDTPDDSSSNEEIEFFYTTNPQNELDFGEGVYSTEVADFLSAVAAGGNDQIQINQNRINGTAPDPPTVSAHNTSSHYMTAALGGLTPETTYTLTVKASNADKTVVSDASSELSFTTETAISAEDFTVRVSVSPETIVESLDGGTKRRATFTLLIVGPRTPLGYIRYQAVFTGSAVVGDDYRHVEPHADADEPVGSAANDIYTLGVGRIARDSDGMYRYDREFRVDIEDDSTPEIDETIVMTLTAVDNQNSKDILVVEDGVATVTISLNDGATPPVALDMPEDFAPVSAAAGDSSGNGFRDAKDTVSETVAILTWALVPEATGYQLTLDRMRDGSAGEFAIDILVEDLSGPGTGNYTLVENSSDVTVLYTDAGISRSLTGLTPGTTYNATLIAVIAGDDTRNSVAATTKFTTLGGPPAAPGMAAVGDNTGVYRRTSGVRSDTAVVVSWEIVDGATGYTLTLSPNRATPDMPDTTEEIVFEFEDTDNDGTPDRVAAEDYSNEFDNFVEQADTRDKFQIIVAPNTSPAQRTSDYAQHILDGTRRYMAAALGRLTGNTPYKFTVKTLKGELSSEPTGEVEFVTTGVTLPDGFAIEVGDDAGSVPRTGGYRSSTAVVLSWEVVEEATGYTLTLSPARATPGMSNTSEEIVFEFVDTNADGTLDELGDDIYSTEYDGFLDAAADGDKIQLKIKGAVGVSDQFTHHAFASDYYMAAALGGLTAEIDWRVTLKARNATSESAASAALEFTTLAGLDAPDDISIGFQTDTTAVFTWNPVPDVTGYELILYRYNTNTNTRQSGDAFATYTVDVPEDLDGDIPAGLDDADSRLFGANGVDAGKYVLVADDEDAAGQLVRYAVTGLDGHGRVYEAEVVAVRGAVKSQPTVIISRTKLPPPENFTASDVTRNSAKLTWDQATSPSLIDGFNNGYTAEQYRVWLNPGRDEDETEIILLDAPAVNADGKHEYALTDLAEGISYTVNLQAWRGAGGHHGSDSELTDAVTFTTLGETPIVTPTAPVLGSGKRNTDSRQVSDTAVTLSWRIVDDVAGYILTLNQARTIVNSDGMEVTEAEIKFEFKDAGDVDDDENRIFDFGDAVYLTSVGDSPLDDAGESDLIQLVNDGGSVSNQVQHHTTDSGYYIFAVLGRLTPGTDYTVTLKAFNADNDESMASGELEFTTLAAPAGNNAPVITSDANVDVNEGVTMVATLMATDADDDTLTWNTTIGGDDAAHFTLTDNGSGNATLVFDNAKDHENPDDADANRVYNIIVSVSDGTDTVTQNMAITLMNVDEIITVGYEFGTYTGDEGDSQWQIGVLVSSTTTNLAASVSNSLVVISTPTPGGATTDDDADSNDHGATVRNITFEVDSLADGRDDFNVSITDDALNEPAEALTLTLSFQAGTAEQAAAHVGVNTIEFTANRRSAELEISTDADDVTITVTDPGTASAASKIFMATDDGAYSTTWHYVLIAGDADCDDTTDFNSAAAYNENDPVTLTAPGDNGMKLCFRNRLPSITGVQEAFQASAVIGGITAPAGNQVPVANAGPDRTGVTVNTQVTLDGSGSSDGDGDPLTYTWRISIQPTGSSVSLSSPTAEMPTFTPAVAGAYMFSLTVNDGTDSSTPDTVTITVVEESNLPPTVNAGRDQTVISGDSVTLTGTASDNDGSVASQRWTVTPSGIRLTGDTTLEITFTAPDVTETTRYTFTLTATDNEGGVGSDTLTLTVEPPLSLTLGEIPSGPAASKTLSVTPSSDDADLDYLVVDAAGACTEAAFSGAEMPVSGGAITLRDETLNRKFICVRAQLADETVVMVSAEISELGTPPVFARDSILIAATEGVASTRDLPSVTEDNLATPPYTLSDQPGGVTLSGATLNISNSVTVGRHHFTVTVTDIAGLTDTLAVTLQVRAAATSTELDVSGDTALTEIEMEDIPDDLTELDISETGVTDLPADLLMDVPDLMVLDIADAPVRALPPDLLDRVPELTTLDISGTEVDELPAGLLDNVPDLTTLDLSDTQVSTADLPENLFAGLTVENDPDTPEDETDETGLTELALPANTDLVLETADEASEATVDSEHFTTRLHLPQAAPFDLTLELSVSPDTARIIAGGPAADVSQLPDTNTPIPVTIPAGGQMSEQFTVYQGSPVTLTARVTATAGMFVETVGGTPIPPENAPVRLQQTTFFQGATEAQLATQTVAIAHAANAAISQMLDVVQSRLNSGSPALSRAGDAGGNITLGGKTFGWRESGMTNASFLTDAIHTLCGTRGMQDGQRQSCELRSLGDLLRGGSFEYSTGNFGDVQNVSGWGQHMRGSFSGKLARGTGADATYDGELDSVYLGMDVERGDDTMFGLALSSVDGNVDIEVPGDDDKKMDIELDGVTPYMRWRGDDRNVWVMAGTASGNAKAAGEEQTDLRSRMVALGMNGRFDGERVQMTWKSDAHYSDINGESDLDSSSWRARHAVGFDFPRLWRGGVLKRNVEIGARLDGGDMQDALSRNGIGGGADLALGVTYSGALDLSLRAKTLVWHTNEDTQEAGLTLQISRAARGDRGFQFALQPAWGDAVGGSSMWGSDTRALPGATSSDAEGFDWSPREVTMKLGYGFDTPGANALVTPIVEWSQNGTQARTKLGVSVQSPFKSLDKLRLNMFMEENRMKLEGRLDF